MKINNWADYREAFRELDLLVENGFEEQSNQEARFANLAKAIESFEDSMGMMPVKPPQTLPEMIQYKMIEKKLKQKDLAVLLEVSAARLSEVLNGKRSITMNLAKKLYERLQINPEFILKSA